MMVASSELAMESRWREAAELAEQVVDIAPAEHSMWWILGQAYDHLGRDGDARNAYAQVVQHAPKRADLRGMRSFAAREAGLPFDDSEDVDDDSEQPLVMFTVNIGGKNAMIQARNDSGTTLDAVVEAAETFVRAVNPFEAWIHAKRHRELFTSIADVVLSAMAQSQSNVRARTGVERYRDALRRVREGEGVVPFAEMAQISAEDFLAFVTSVDDVQPPMMELSEASSEEERREVIGRHPELLSDRALTFLRLLAGVQRDRDARAMMQNLFSFLRRARRGGEVNADDTSAAALEAGIPKLSAYERTGDPDDLAAAHAIFSEALRANPDSDAPMLPYYLGLVLLRRFEHDGEPRDLDDAIAAMRQVLALVVDGTQAEGAARSMLGSMLMRRGERTGSLPDLDESVAAQRLASTAEAEPEQLALRLSNLGTACVERFGLSGDAADLDEAERCYDEALGILPGNTAILGGFARLCRARYTFGGDDAWLDRAIDTYRFVIGSEEAPLNTALALNNLSSSLRDRFLASGDRADLDAAIDASRRAVAAVPRGSVQRPVWFENLGNTLRTRAVYFGDAADRRDAIAAFEEAMAVAPEGADIWRTAPANLGGLLVEDPEDADRGLELLELGLERMKSGPPNIDSVEIGRGLAREYARREEWEHAGEVLRVAIDALEGLQRTQLSSEAKKAWLTKASELHILAAEMFFRAGRPGEALVAIERGRGRLLAEVLGRDRVALEELARTGDRRLVERYRNAAGQVRMLSAAAAHGQNVQAQLRAALDSLEAVIDTVRGMTGDLAFSQPPTDRDIVAASEEAGAPLVYLVPLSAFGVGVVVRGAQGRIHTILLPELTINRVNETVTRYADVYAAALRTRDWNAWETTLNDTVRWCWESCMRAVVAELGEVAEAVLIPLGRLGRLPLHVAADSDGSALETHTWRYAPNARSLVQLGSTDTDSLLLTVTFADPDDLPYITLEAASARRSFSNHRALDGSSATRDAVLDEMRHATVLHFACHATGSSEDPRAVGLMLADGMLSLQDLFDARLASGAIAVLSACETGVIGETLPDEVLSIASGMLQAGASAVVSSLWSVPDESTAILMSRFYCLWRIEGQPPANALRDAQRWMRDSNNGTIAAFLREHLGDLADRSLVQALERTPLDSTFAHQVHWAAFTYMGR
jgi:tetratricopeptide (TPR) repeat protein